MTEHYPDAPYSGEDGYRLRRPPSRLEQTIKTTDTQKRRNPFRPKRTYTKKEYHSNDGMLPTVWGPSMWHVLHTMSFNYPVCPTRSQKTAYRQFLLNLENVLPCGKCRKNLRENFKKLPLKYETMKTRDTFSRYVYDLHEVVNKMLHKKSGLSFNDVRERYEHFRARCSPTVPNNNAEHNTNGRLRQPSPSSGKDNNTLRSPSSRLNNKPLTPSPLHPHVGCDEPFYGKKSKCVLHIVPDDTPCKTFTVDEKCKKIKIK